MKAQLTQNNVPLESSKATLISDSPWSWLLDLFRELEKQIPAKTPGWHHRMMVKYYGSDAHGWRIELTLEVQREDGVVVDLFLSVDDIEDQTPERLAAACAAAAKGVKAPKRTISEDDDDDED